MLSYEQAKKIGIDACVEKIGEDFVSKHEDNLCVGYGDVEDYAYCFVGVDDAPEIIDDREELVLDSTSKWPFIAKCNVWYNDGHIEFFDCKLPKVNETTMV